MSAAKKTLHLADVEPVAPANGNARTSGSGAPPADDEPWPTDDQAPDAPPPSNEPQKQAEQKQAEQKQAGRRAATPDEVIGQWLAEGRLVHEPTGIAKLDELTGGGPVYGSRWYLAGAPDAGKTALLLQLAHEYAQRGVVAGLLAVDEEPSDIVTRMAQRIGYQRIDCEIREPKTLDLIRSELGVLPMRFYDDSWTIEAAAADLAAFAKARADADPKSHPNGPRAFLGIDSLQTVACDAERVAAPGGKELSEVSAVTARVRAIRSVATKHRLIAVATSELGRGAYRSSDPSQQTATMASAKWSGAVEYSARVLLGLRSVPNETDLVDLEIAKNKHGPRDEHVFLRIDRRSQTLIPADYAPPPAETAADRDDAKRDRAQQDAVTVAKILLRRPGIQVLELRAAAEAAGMGHGRADAALAVLDEYEAVVREKGARGAKAMTLDLALLPVHFRRALGVAE